MSNVCHIEIPILDLEKAKEFYQNVFKWEVNTEAL
ncbi:MAG: VOC family protein, partial [Candidatus Kariarchaeaceae archaeon]